MRLMRHGIEGQHNPGNFIDPGFGGGSFQQAGAEHVVQGAADPLIDCVALGMVMRSEDLLDPREHRSLVQMELMNSLPRSERSLLGVPK